MGLDLDMGSLKRLIGTEIKRAREAADLTQEDLADRMDCHPQTVSDWERGKSNLSLERLEEIARKIGVPPTSLLPKPDSLQEGVGLAVRRLYRQLDKLAVEYELPGSPIKEREFRAEASEQSGEEGEGPSGEEVPEDAG